MTTARIALQSVSLAALALSAMPAWAQDESELPRGAQTDAEIDDDFHSRGIGPNGEIVVTVQGLTQLDVLAGTSVMEGLELQRSLDGQLGEVLANLPGVSATSFSPGASRPVLRGFAGERVRVLVDGIGAIDVSNTSADHATSIDPLTAERIEVLRGPAVLLYGSQAIGGAVNVIDKRIPRRLMTENFHVDAVVEADTARDLWGGGASLDVPIGESVVVHASGSYRTTNDLEIAGFAAAPGLRAELLDEAAQDEADGAVEEADELREAAGQRGILPNSATETWSANIGGTFFRGGSSLGISFGIYDTNYGVPGRPGAGHHAGGGDGEDASAGLAAEAAEAEDVSIDLHQFRADLRGVLDLGEGLFDTLTTRVGYSDYRHIEFEGPDIGTVFDVKGAEARAELAQNQRGAWSGTLGVQYYFRDFDAFGAEAYVAPNLTDQLAFFALQELTFGPVQVEAAGRYETTDVGSRTLNIDRSYDAFSGALSLIYETPAAEPLRLGITGSRAARAPSAEELFSNGPHIATQAFEIGDPDLAIERAWGVEAFVRGRLGPANISLSVFQNWFDNYIALEGTALEEDDLPVFVYLQQDADYFGVEGEIDFPIGNVGPFALSGDVRGDYIKAKLADGSAIPRIPPLSLSGAVEAQSASFDARVEAQWNAAQDNVAAFETATDSFTHVNASLSWKPIAGDNTIRVMLQAQNIFDAMGRRHASFTKDFVPLAGRNFKLTVRTSF